MSTKIQSIVPDELAKSLVFVARAFKRSQSYIVCQAVENYLREQMENIEDGEMALQIEKESDGTYITLEAAEEMAAKIRNV